MRVIHCLHEGRPLCGKPGVPGEWAEGHVWVGVIDWKGLPDATGHDKCLGCVHAFKLREGGS